MANEKKDNLLAIIFSLPWCCILPAVFSLLGLISGIAAIRVWSVRVSPFFFLLMLIFLVRAFWLIYVRHQGNRLSSVIVWMTSIIVGALWIFRLRYFLRSVIILVVIAFTSASSAFAHEPVFSLGPETIYKDGVGIETEVEYEKSGSERSFDLHEEIIYGLREDLSLTARFPFILEKKELDSTSSGFGDLALRAKYRFYKKDYFGAQDKAAFIGGVKFPTGDEDKNPSLGTGSFDYLLGLTAGHESLKWYYFGTVRYRINNENGSNEKGDKFLYDIAFGLRPVLKEYYEPDLVLLLELSGEHRNKDIISGVKNIDSGGDILYLGPTFLWSYRNWMIKGGIQLPIYQNLNGDQEDEDFRSVIAVEVHF